MDEVSLDRDPDRIFKLLVASENELGISAVTDEAFAGIPEDDFVTSHDAPVGVNRHLVHPAQ